MHNIFTNTSGTSSRVSMPPLASFLPSILQPQYRDLPPPIGPISNRPSRPFTAAPLNPPKL
ncbi:predicted protein [Plenodomus lingam JN3]|uniref:Predicted protein n=1 Tax=Leptosphaeria maculans (strain JN3 / isolate v23.1.3 / race Av1-4-5-6-7-8) TaxID=985895 RepID=E5A4G2_LEPMJ|nr:predicted protein [Plenodomus lingam JN3]CBX98507.1 predicted protein [Plenodomus lingam JN3]